MNKIYLNSFSPQIICDHNLQVHETIGRMYRPIVTEGTVNIELHIAMSHFLTGSALAKEYYDGLFNLVEAYTKEFNEEHPDEDGD